jgi:hypothetical protein
MIGLGPGVSAELVLLSGDQQTPFPEASAVGVALHAAVQIEAHCFGEEPCGSRFT